MQVLGIKTHKITENDKNILDVLDRYLLKLEENSVVAVTSKIVSICEGSFASLTSDKEKLIEEESQYFLPKFSNKYNISFAIKNNILAAGAGIDESNANGQYILWPKDAQKSANEIRQHLVQKFNQKNIGVIITDSKTSPLRWGVTGTALAHSGFCALKNYIDTPDLFGRPFKFEQLNIADSLAASAVLLMGEGAEQMPLAIVSDVPFVEYQDRNPTKDELDKLRILLEDDLYAPLLTSVKWQKGKKP